MGFFKRRTRKFRLPGGCRGYTLAELLVAVAIFSVTIAGIVAVLRKGIETTVTDTHRKRARTIIDSCFESASYQPANYAGMAAVNRAVLIDARNEGSPSDDLSGTLTISVTDQTDNSRAPAVAYKQVRATVQWTEPEGGQSLVLDKWVTAL